MFIYIAVETSSINKRHIVKEKILVLRNRKKYICSVIIKKNLFTYISFKKCRHIIIALQEMEKNKDKFGKI